MSQAHIEQFYAIAAKDDKLYAKMMEGTTGPDDFIANAVKEAKALGYTFTAEEGAAWIKTQQETKATGELSDSQLESVAGGKTAKNTILNAVHWTNGAVRDVKNYFSNW